MIDSHQSCSAESESELLPCPFCGGLAKRHDIEAREDVDNAGASYIECSRCGACTQLHFDRKDNLLDSWNSRVKEPAEDEAARLRFDLRACRGRAEIDQRNLRHWREECGKLHAQIATAKDQRNAYQKKAQEAVAEIQKLKADLQAWEITARRIEEAERPKDVECPTCEGSGEIFRGIGGPDDPERCHVCTGTGIVRRYLDDGSCIRCGAAPRNASGLCATCVDEDAVRAGEISDLAGVAEQSGAGAPETPVRCGAPAAQCDHDWQIWPETDGQEQHCMKCGKYRKTQIDIEECGNHSAGSPPR